MENSYLMRQAKRWRKMSEYSKKLDEYIKALDKVKELKKELDALSLDSEVEDRE